jgi:hypothetical protein
MRDYQGKYAKKESIWSGVFGIVILATLFLVLNHFNAARLDEVSKNNCLVTTGNADCSPLSLNAAN